MRRLAAAAALSLLAAGPVAAHHGWSGYDATRLITLDGTVQSFDYDNPHAQLVLRTADKTLRVVLAPPSRMSRRGLAADAIQPDQAVSVQGYPNREEADEFRAERISFGGQTIELR